MSGFLGIEQARSRLGDLCRQTALGRERTAITEDGTTLAVLISPQELADLEDELALARNRLNEARGFPDPVVTQDELLAEFAGQDAAEGRAEGAVRESSQDGEEQREP